MTFSLKIKCINIYFFFLFRGCWFLTIASLSVSGVSSSTVTGIWAHGIHTICIRVTVMGVGSALLQVCKKYITKWKRYQTNDIQSELFWKLTGVTVHRVWVRKMILAKVWRLYNIFISRLSTLIGWGFCDIRNNQGRGNYNQPWPEAEADYTCLDLDYSGYHKNWIQLLSYYTLFYGKYTKSNVWNASRFYFCF